MDSLLSSFNQDLQQLENYIQHIDYINQFARYKLKEKDSKQIKELFNKFKEHSRNFRSRKVLEYNAIIVTLYGYLERFIEDLIIEYLENLNKIIPKYTNLPEKIQKNHFDFSAKLLQNLEYPKYSGKITKEKIIKNLNSCIEETNYKINALAYIDHKANFKHDVIRELVKELGININEIKTVPSFKEYIQSKLEPELQSSPGGKEDDLIFNKLEDLAQRRNDVSHGVRVQVILSIDLLSEYIDFIRHYCSGLHEIFMREITRYKIQYKAVPLENIVKIFDGKILGISIPPNLPIKVGNKILVQTDSSFMIKTIEEIQINKIKYPEINLTKEDNVAFQISPTKPKVKENHKFYLETT